MRPDKIYFPIDAADVYRVPPPPRVVPPLLDEFSMKDFRRGAILVAVCGLASLMGALLLPGWWRLTAALPLVPALGGVSQILVARTRRTVWRDGEVALARVYLVVGGVKTEIRYVEKEGDVTDSGDVGVFAGEPGAHAVLEYEFEGRLHEDQVDLSELGKPLAVRVGDKLGCGVMVHPSKPDSAILITSRLVRSTLNA